jgi:hypothetical protein
MSAIFGIVGGLSILASFAAATAIKSDIQIILACVLFLGGMNLIGLTAVLNRLQARSAIRLE